MLSLQRIDHLYEVCFSLRHEHCKSIPGIHGRMITFPKKAESKDSILPFCGKYILVYESRNF